MHLKILADAMGLGKTIMTLALLLTHSETGTSPGNQSPSQHSVEAIEGVDFSDQSPNLPKKAPKFPVLDKVVKKNNTLPRGGTLIICPMTLLGQWKVSVLPFRLYTCYCCIFISSSCLVVDTCLIIKKCQPFYCCIDMLFIWLESEYSLYYQAEIETHAEPGSLSLYAHYGKGRQKDANILAESDVVITTYGVLTSEFSSEVG